MRKVGIMQGRLSRPPAGTLQAFPWQGWQDEFARARDCGFNCLEWLVTAERLDDNPIWTDDGIDTIRDLAVRTSVAVSSLCADCFIAHPFVRVADAERDVSLRRLQLLVRHAAAAGIGVLVVPVIERGELRSSDEGVQLIATLAPVLAEADSLGIRVALECDWPGAQLRKLLELAPRPLFSCHDIGNARARGQNPAEEIAALGDRLAAVHVKDRRVNGGSVSLGSGDVDLTAAFAALETVGYEGSLILETPAGADPIASARANLAVVRARL